MRYKIEAAQNNFSVILVPNTRIFYDVYIARIVVQDLRIKSEDDNDILNFLGSLNFSVQLFAPQKSEPCRAAIPYVEDKRLAAGVQVLPNAGAGPTLLFWMNTLTTCAVSFQKTEN